MISLVDYANSDSDDTSLGEKEDEREKNDSMNSTLLQQMNAAGPKMPCTQHDGHETAYIDMGPLRQLISPNLGLRGSPENRGALEQSSADVVKNHLRINKMKQVHHASIGVRPYIPKRQRTMTTNMPEVTEVNSTHAMGPLLFTKTAEKISSFLGRRFSRTERPRWVQFQMRAHLGPVNVVHWCPVPELSHLLLSASMDKTIKVWDGVESGQCLQSYSLHCEAVRDACWSACGRRFLSGSFDKSASLTDLSTGQDIAKMDNQFKVTCLALQPTDPNVFLCGGYSPEVKAWDLRSCKVVRVYKARIQQTLDILFLHGGKEFVTSSDSVSHDSAERTLIAWDFDTTAKVSNQIFHERYTCPSLALHPEERGFVAQTNGNYIALFSSQRPYRMNKKKRYEGHKVEGYDIRCEYSSDGKILATGSSSGAVHFYDSWSTQTLQTLHAHQHSCTSVSFHPVIPGCLATCDWGGEIKIWN